MDGVRSPGDRRPGGSDGLSRGRRRPRRALPGWQGPTGRSPGARGRRTMESPCVLQDRRMLFGGRGPTPPSNRSLIHGWRAGGAGATYVWDLPNRTAAGPVASRRRAGSAGAAGRSRRRRRPTPPRITVSWTRTRRRCPAEGCGSRRGESTRPGRAHPAGAGSAARRPRRNGAMSQAAPRPMARISASGGFVARGVRSPRGVSGARRQSAGGTSGGAAERRGLGGGCRGPGTAYERSAWVRRERLWCRRSSRAAVWRRETACSGFSPRLRGTRTVSVEVLR